jgi:hypothetical protein
MFVLVLGGKICAYKLSVMTDCITHKCKIEVMPREAGVVYSLGLFLEMWYLRVGCELAAG